MKSIKIWLFAVVLAVALTLPALATSPPQDNKSYRGDINGDFIITLSDVNATRNRSLLIPVDYSAVVPGNTTKGDTADITGDTVVSLADVNSIRDISLLKNFATPDLPWSIDTSDIPLNITETAPIQVAVTNLSGFGRPGIVVRFSVASGPATLSGREYNPIDDDIRDHESLPGATQVLAITTTNFPGDISGATELTIPNVGTSVEIICSGYGTVILNIDVLEDVLKGIPEVNASPAVECSLLSICNDGIDNDGDTQTDFPADPGCADLSDNDETGKIGSDVRITNNGWTSQNPSLVWTGTEYGVSWEDDRIGNYEIYFAKITAIGNKSTGDFQLTNNAFTSEIPSLVWTGTEYGLSWYDFRDGNEEIYFTRIEASGNKIEPDVSITTNDGYVSRYPSLVWTGTEYGLSWHDYRDGNWEIYFTRIDALGNKIGVDMRITNNTGDSYGPSLVWTGTEYGVSWEEFRGGDFEIYFARIDTSGNKIGADVRITAAAGDSRGPSLVWTGTEYGISWQEYRDGNWEIYFARINASGTKQGADVRITNDVGSSVGQSLVWAGTEYGVSWEDNRDGNTEIYFARIDGSGNKINSDLRITNDTSSSRYPSLVWTGTEYGVSWVDWRDGNAEIYFARID